MRAEPLALLMTLTLLTPIVGCGEASDSSSYSSTSTANVDASLYTLAEEPDGAVGVIEARESAQDGKPLVLVGRIGGSDKPWIDGRAAFILLDASMTVVAEGEDFEEGEICTGDCCAAELLHCTTLVKVVDAEGKLLAVDSRELLGLKESDMVVVQGTAKKDDSGNFVMLARGVYVRN
jgi:hypothetical protein